MIKILNLDIVLLIEHQNIKRFLLKAIFQKLQTLHRGHVISDLKREEIVARKRNIPKTDHIV